MKTVAAFLCTLPLLAGASIQNTAIQDGLTLHLPFDENTGHQASDASGGDLRARLRNKAAWTVGIHGAAVALDGQNDWVDLGHRLDVARNASATSIAVWIRLADLPLNGASRGIFSLSVGSSPPSNTARLDLAVTGDGTAADLVLGARASDTEVLQTLLADANLPAGIWIHVAATVDYGAGRLCLYANGAQVAQAPAAFSRASTSDTAARNGAVGARARGDGDFFKGALDDLRVYDRRLSPTEIAVLASVPPPLPPVLSGEAGDAQVRLSWTAPVRAESYDLQRANALDGPYGTLANVTALAYTDAAVVNGIPYFYRVLARNAAGTSDPSNRVELRPSAPAPLTAPIILAPTASAILITGTPTVSGSSSDAGLTVTLLADGIAVASTTSGADGTWSVAPSAALAEGNRILSAQTTDGTSTSPLSVAVPVLIDTVVPVLSAPLPAPDATTFDRQPSIAASWSDAGSGIDPDAAVLTLDGQDFTSAAVRSAGGISYVPPAILDFGAHQVAIFVRDRAGHPASLSWSFTVQAPGDPTPPVISNPSPAPGSTTYVRRPVLSANWADSIQLGSASVVLDDVDVTSSATVTTSGFSYAPLAPLSEGAHTVVARVADVLGRFTTLTWSFEIIVDSTPPAITGLSPSDKAAVVGPIVELSASLADAGIGLDLPSIEMTLNGVVVPATVAPDGSALRYTSSLLPGPHAFGVRARDLAGNQAGPVIASFVVDPQPPIIELASPASGQSYASLQIPFAASVDDGALGSGVAMSDLRVELNGADVTAGVAMSFQPGGSISLGGILDAVAGSNTLVVRATDRAGNPGHATSEFRAEASTAGPQLSAVQPRLAGWEARIRLLGSGFGVPGETSVVFSPGITVEEFELHTDTTLILRVPFQAVTGPLRVRVNGVDSPAAAFELLEGYISPVPAASILADDQGHAILSTSDLIVCLEDFQGADRADQLAALGGGQRAGYIASNNSYVIRYPTTTLADLLTLREQVKAQAGVEFAAPALGTIPAQDATRRRYERDRSEGRTGVWAWDRIQAQAAWKLLEGASLNPVKVAVWDTGIDSTHIDFNGVTVTSVGASGWWEGPNRFPDTYGHGTLVAGIIGAAANGVGIDGVMAVPLQRAGKAYTLMTFDLLTKAGNDLRFAHNLIHDIDRAAMNGARVINVSAGMPFHRVRDVVRMQPGVSDIDAATAKTMLDHIFMLRKALDVPGGRKILVVLAAGNYNTDVSSVNDDDLDLFGSLNRWGPIGSAMVVGALGLDGDRWMHSNAGTQETAIDIAAPGESVLGPIPLNSRFGLEEETDGRPIVEDESRPESIYRIDSGTSLACPQVSGTAALLFSMNPNLKAPAVKQILQDHALRVKVRTPVGGQVTWKVLRMADTISGFAPSLAANKSWSRVYASVYDSTAGRTSIRKVKKIRRTANTYVAEEVEIFQDNVYQSFAVAADGRSLVRGFTENPGSQEVDHIYRYSLLDGSASVVVNTPYTFVDETYLGMERINTSLNTTPVVFASDAVAYLSNRHYQPRLAGSSDYDQARYEPSMAGHGPLTSIDRTQFRAITPGVAGATFPGGVTLPMPPSLSFGRMAPTPDNRWLLFCNSESYLVNDGTFVLLMPNPTVEKPEYQDPQVRALTGHEQFLTLTHADTDAALDFATRPAVSPDGSRLAYIDPRFSVANSLRIVKLRRKEMMRDDKGLAIIKPWHYTEVFEVPGKASVFAWSPCGSFLLYLDPDVPGVVKIISGNLGEYAAGAPPPSATTLFTIPNSPWIPGIEWSWSEQ